MKTRPYRPRRRRASIGPSTMLQSPPSTMGKRPPSSAAPTEAARSRATVAITNDHLRDAIVAQLPSVPKAQVLAEPMQRNTAPAIGLAAHILRSLDPDAVMGVFPADHVVSRPAVYRSVVRAAFRGAAAGHLMVVGIRPRWPETGYGYIEFPRGVQAGTPDPFPVKRFREKPALAQAKRYVAAGNFYWNSDRKPATSISNFRAASRPERPIPFR